jgi:hypothetical protein
MAGYTLYSVATGVTGNGSVNLGDEYAAALVALTTIPDHYGSTAGPGRIVYYRIGYIAVGRTSGEISERKRLEMTSQVFPAEINTINRVFHWLEPGIVATIYAMVWS